MAQFGAAIKGKQEVRKEIGLIAMAHRTTWVMQSTIAHSAHLIEGFIRGLSARRPALFNIYASCQPEHGIGDDMGAHQAKLVVESRAYPLFRYDPDRGVLPEECFDLDGNPAIDRTWPTYALKYREGGRERTMEVPMTFADFAITEVRFRKHFRRVPQEAWHDAMIPLAELLELEPAEREGKYPYVWSVDREGHLERLLVAQPMVASSEDRRDFWRQLRALAGVGRTAPTEATAEIEQKIRGEVIARITQGLFELAGGSGAAPSAAAPAPVTAAPTGGSENELAPWIDSAECTSCDECIKINPQIFAYDANKKAFVKNPDGGPYRDLVKAAERCTAQVIHPGLPRNPAEKDLDKLVARAAKYN
jgi:pyruvate-ferredoxin/flavodoxin oxidoreductase